MEFAVVGGGAAGFFAAIACAETDNRNSVTIYEKSSHPLQKVRISGGGRCNVTHANFEPREFVTRYPRGSRQLIGAMHSFGAAETVAWFERRGVRLKTEPDGRMFPVTDSSGTVIDCLMFEARQAGVRLRTKVGIESATAGTSSFELALTGGETARCDRLLLATGGARDPSGARLAEMLGHTIEPAVPSLFSFESEDHPLRELAGVSVTHARVEVAGTKLRERGALLITHRGLSGPVVLRVSAWGARELFAKDYRFNAVVDWLPDMSTAAIAEHFAQQRSAHPNKLVLNSPIPPLPSRLWETLAQSAGINASVKWTNLRRDAANAFATALHRTEIAMNGKSLNKEEFVTCGGVRLSEVNFKTMESRVTPGLFFAGELLDIDGITGGFNFQSAWTTGYLAGIAMARQ